MTNLKACQINIPYQFCVFTVDFSGEFIVHKIIVGKMKKLNPHIIDLFDPSDFFISQRISFVVVF